MQGADQDQRNRRCRRQIWVGEDEEREGREDREEMAKYFAPADNRGPFICLVMDVEVPSFFQELRVHPIHIPRIETLHRPQHNRFFYHAAGEACNHGDHNKMCGRSSEE